MSGIYLSILSRESASSADESSCSGTPTPVKQTTSGSGDHTYFRQKSNPSTSSPVVGIKPLDILKSQVSDDLVLNTASKSVTTLELHSEEQTSTPDVTLTFTECPALQTQESSQQREITLEMEEVEKHLEDEGVLAATIIQKAMDVDEENEKKMTETQKHISDDTTGPQTQEERQSSEMETKQDTREKMETNKDEPMGVKSKATDGDIEGEGGEKAVVDKVLTADDDDKGDRLEVKTGGQQSVKDITSGDAFREMTETDSVREMSEAKSEQESGKILIHSKNMDVEEDLIKEVKDVLSHIEDLVVSEIDKDAKSPGKDLKKCGTMEENEPMEVESSERVMQLERNSVDKDEINVQKDPNVHEDGVGGDEEFTKKVDDNGKEHLSDDSQGSATNPAVEMEKLEEELEIEQDARLVDQINTMLKLPVEELHRELIEGCRKALIMCLQRFSTHYKTHYRLAYLYVHSPYHRVSSRFATVFYWVVLQ